MITCRKCCQKVERYRNQANICRPCWAEYMKAYQKANRTKILAHKRAYHHRKRTNPEWVNSERKRGREYWQLLRREVIKAYGGMKCKCCGEVEEQFLTIDHINNDGASHRRAIGGKNGNGKGMGARTWKWLKDNNYPKGFQVLCMNCNLGKSRNKGICPHKLKVSLENCVNSVEDQNGQYRAKARKSKV